MPEFIIDKVSHTEVDKGVAAALVLDLAPSQGSNSLEEGGNWTRTSLKVPQKCLNQIQFLRTDILLKMT